MAIGFVAQVFVPKIGTDAWADQHDRQELILDNDYGGFCTGDLPDLDPVVVRYLFPSWEQALKFVRARTPFVVEAQPWPVAFGPDYIRAYAGTEAEMFLLVQPSTKAVVGYITLAPRH